MNVACLINSCPVKRQFIFKKKKEKVVIAMRISVASFLNFTPLTHYLDNHKNNLTISIHSINTVILIAFLLYCSYQVTSSLDRLNGMTSC